MDVTVSKYVDKHKAVVLAFVTGPYSNVSIAGVRLLIKSLESSCFGFNNYLNFLEQIYKITG